MHWRAAFLHYLTLGSLMIFLGLLTQVDRWTVDGNAAGLFATLFFVVAIFFVLLMAYVRAALAYLQNGH